MGNTETATKLSRLKSISSIEGNCLEAATGGVLYKKAVLKNFAIFTGKTTVLESLFNNFLEKFSNFIEETPT